MVWLFIFALCGALVVLWLRMTALERALTRLEEAETARGSGPIEPLESAVPVTSMPRADAPPQRAEPFASPFAPTSEPTVSPEPLASVVAAEAEPETEARKRPAFALPRVDFEELFGRRLPIWAGGIALAVGGILLVRLAIENGMLTPPVRVAASFAFGLFMLAGAEAAFRFETRVADPRVRQALAGAGLATLYAAFYLAGSAYGLIGPALAFTGLAVVTAIALGLALRFGLPAAVLGMLGGFATPAMVASEDANLPVLSLYLALLTAGLAITGRRIGAAWLGFAALAGGFGWGAAILASATLDRTDAIAVGLYLALLGLLVPFLAGPVARWRWPRVAAAALASVQLAVLVALAGFAPLTWGLYLLLAGALAALAWREERLREGSAFAVATGVALLALWHGVDLLTAPPGWRFAIMATVLAAISCGVPLLSLVTRRARAIDLWQLALGGVAIGLVASLRFDPGAEPRVLLALGLVTLAALPGAGLALLWRADADGRRLWLPAAAAGAVLLLAGFAGLPPSAFPFVAATIAGGLVWIARERPASGTRAAAWMAATIAFATLFAMDPFGAELLPLIGARSVPASVLSTLRWLALALPFAGLAWIETRESWRRAAEALAALIGYGALAQIVPVDALVCTVAVAGAAVLWRSPVRGGAWGTLLLIAAGWALGPFAIWLEAVTPALWAEPPLAHALPPARDALLRIVPLTVLGALAAWRGRAHAFETRVMGGGALALAIVALHIVYYRALGPVDMAGWRASALLLRTGWELLLLMLGAGLIRYARHRDITRTGVAFAALALTHFAVFGIGIDNPLWRTQSVGPWPLVDGLLAAYATAFAAALLLGALASKRGLPLARPLRDAILMILIAAYALSELRHLFAGPVLTAAPLSQTEDLQRSLLGILLALGFLAWGWRSDTRSWRIGSLVLMLIAVGKVFLVDTAGLEGLLRIASFLALGFSLIGIGWVYSRLLRST
ncbi:DUF2339 domain-containing protein [Erythrobacter sp. 3-20A1M]|uniref:DUF2339 domain-containing protein n=1 Tax=Erythrobacter sp. 3-20A1M TaxID=2653850 RepID=UPI001BFC536D|nr:DUF2339 domain-containing protein [Erythrobacter sp. 3-20A1M]QWC56472.1 DUF2339 domain-containing protein [Erythrobacter sp. 3-20A1M]